MTNQTVVMTDSTCGLPAHIIEREGLIVIPCQVRIGDEIYKEGVDLSAEELFERLFNSTAVPATSLPAGEDYTAAFEEAQQRGATQVLGIFLGSAFSGTFNGARLAAQEHPLTVELVDSGTTSLPLGLLALRATELLRSGHSLQETATEIRHLADRAELYALLDTLEFVRRGGRIGRVGELIANVLNIKPALRVARNSADVVARIRSRKKGLQWLIETSREMMPLQAVGVIHIDVDEEAAALAQELAALVPEQEEMFVVPATAAVASHAGPRAIGIGLLR